ncbi:MAG: MMPL family transporter, partial [Acidimicrobiia bacterium]|nr:MMPL family transporter [Acidimicrobiia bacterium]
MLAAIGRWSFDHPKAALAGWVAALITILGLAGSLGAAFNATFEVPESETSRGFETLDTYFDGLGAGAPGSIVFKAERGVDDPEVEATMEDLFAEVDKIDGVTVVSPYGPAGQAQISLDGTIAFAQLSLAETIGQTEAAEIGATIHDLLPELDSTQIEIGGQMLAEFEPPESELIGLAFAVVILIVSFGSVMAMGLPIGTAVFGVGI